MGKYCRASQEAGHSVTLRRKDVLCMPDNEGKNIDAHSEYLIFTTFP